MILGEIRKIKKRGAVSIDSDWVKKIGERGKSIYEDRIKHLVDPLHYGKFVVIDVETGDYEIADSFGGANEKLRERHPLPVKFFVFRIGYPAAVRMGVLYGVRL